MASDANTASPTVFERRWCCSSFDGNGLPMRTRLIVCNNGQSVTFGTGIGVSFSNNLHPNALGIRLRCAV